jgi:hypothetical protein
MPAVLAVIHQQVVPALIATMDAAAAARLLDKI